MSARVIRTDYTFNFPLPKDERPEIFARDEHGLFNVRLHQDVENYIVDAMLRLRPFCSGHYNPPELILSSDDFIVIAGNRQIDITNPRVQGWACFPLSGRDNEPPLYFDLEVSRFLGITGTGVAINLNAVPLRVYLDGIQSEIRSRLNKRQEEITRMSCFSRAMEIYSRPDLVTPQNLKIVMSAFEQRFKKEFAPTNVDEMKLSRLLYSWHYINGGIFAVST